ncbi:MAG: hypothetical protein SGPRY_002603 [Prymnesium sp.]
MCREYESTEPSDPDQLRVSGLGIQWRGLSVSFSGRQVLKSISGDVRGGEVLAIMGSSGCGKTTLLNTLSRRALPSEGVVSYGEGELWSPRFKRSVALVEQDDHVFSGLTVGETLRFAAALRLPNISSKEREVPPAALPINTAVSPRPFLVHFRERVTALLRTLRLTKCEHTLVGSTAAVERRGISGGERKRMCIAAEMLTLPALLFCDEPTSGLDASMAAVVASSMLDLARNHGVTVITSIHQPSSQVFALFDKVYLLDSGSVLHDGPPQDIATRLVSIHHPCPPGWNVADWVLRAVVKEELSPAQLDELRRGVPKLPPVEIVTKSKSASAVPVEVRGSWTHEFSVLLRREWKLARPGVVAAFRPFVGSTSFLNIGIGLINGVLYYRLGFTEAHIFARCEPTPSHAPSRICDQVTAAFSHIIICMFFPLIGASGVLPAAETMLRKDLASGAHRLWTWFVIFPTISLLAEAPSILLSITVSYWLGGMADHPGIFILYLLSLTMIICMFQSVGLLLSVLFPTKQVFVVALLLMTFCFLFAGVFQPLSQTTASELALLNPAYYAECILCRLAAFREGYNYVPIGYNETTRLPPIITRDEALGRYSLDTPIWASILILASILIMTRTLAFIMLRRKLRKVLLTSQSAAAAIPLTKRILQRFKREQHIKREQPERNLASSV